MHCNSATIMDDLYMYTLLDGTMAVILYIIMGKADVTECTNAQGESGR